MTSNKKEISMGTLVLINNKRYRILDCYNNQDFILVETENVHNFLHISKQDFFSGLNNGEIVIDDCRVTVSIELTDEEWKEIYRKREVLEYLIASEPSFESLFVSGSKNIKKKKAAKELGVTTRTLNKLLSRYIASGRDVNSLIDQRKLNCAGHSKLEVQNASRESMGLKPIEATESTEKSKRQLALEYGLKCVKDGYNVADALDEALYAFYSDVTIVDGELTIKVIPEKGIINYMALWRYVNDHIKEDSVKDLKKDWSDYENNHRPLTGNQQSGLRSIGQQFQIDECEVPVQLVDEEYRHNAIGKIIVYLIMDSYAEIIVGASIGFENNSYQGMSNALLSTVFPHQEELERYGLTCTDDEFPSMVMPKEYISDCGAEYRSKACEDALRKQGVNLLHATPGCGSKKGGVENAFGRLQRMLKACLLGYGYRRDGIKGTEKAQEEACLSMYELRRIVYEVILYFNTHNMPGYVPDKDMKKAKIKLKPCEIWKYCRETYGNPCNITAGNREQFMFDMLLSNKKLKVDHRRGIHYGSTDLYFFSDEEWFTDMIREKKPEVEIRYNPLFIDYVYTRYKNQIRKVPLAARREQLQTYKGMSWKEYDNFYEDVKDMHDEKSEEDKWEQVSERITQKKRIQQEAETAKVLHGDGKNNTKNINENRSGEKAMVNKDEDEMYQRAYRGLSGQELQINEAGFDKEAEEPVLEDDVQEVETTRSNKMKKIPSAELFND